MPLCLLFHGHRLSNAFRMAGILNFDVLTYLASALYDEGDLACLATCAQVCRLWHSVTRRFIFREIQISTAFCLATFEALLISDPSIGPLVSRLRIRPLVSGPAPAASAWIIGIPRILPTKLTKLRHIELVNLYENGRHCPTIFLHAFLTFTSVERLTVRDSTIVVNLLFAFICALPNLKHVTIGFLHPLLASIYPYPVQLLNPTFTTLDLHIGGAYPFGLGKVLDWLVERSVTSRLRSLSLDIYQGQVVDAGKYLRDHGELLEHLSLNIRPLNTEITPAEDEAIRNDLSLALCKSLQSLTIYEFNPGSVAMLSFIETVSSSDIQEFRLGITHHVADSLIMPAVNALVTVLAKLELGALEKFTFLYRGDLESSDVLGYFKAALIGAPTRVRDKLNVIVVI